MSQGIDAYRPQIEAALEYTSGTHTFEDIRAAVGRGDLQFWPGPHSVMITEIQATPQRRLLNIFLAAGDLRELELMEPQVLGWGKAQGCTEAIFLGRRGWERTFLIRKGWTLPNMVVMEKRL